MVVINALGKMRRHANVAVADVEVGRRRAVGVRRAVDRKAVEPHADERALALRGRNPQRLDVVVILTRRRRMAVVAVEGLNLRAELRISFSW